MYRDLPFWFLAIKYFIYFQTSWYVNSCGLDMKHDSVLFVFLKNKYVVS